MPGNPLPDFTMKILFITHSFPNFVPDLLLHGLRKLFGVQVVDYPKKECLYSKIPDQVIAELYNDLFWFPPDDGEIDREDIHSKLCNNFFDYIISDVRALKFLNHYYEKLSANRSKLVIIDGEDFPAKIIAGKFVICRRETDGTDFSIPLPMALPEEIFHHITSFDNNPKTYSVGFLGAIGGENYGNRQHQLEEIEHYYPDSLIRKPTISFDIKEHLENRVGLSAYYDMLQRCKFVLNLKGAGYDTFRFWENCACNAVNVSESMPLFIPNDFKDKQHIIRFSNIDDLRKITDNLIENKDKYDKMVQTCREHLIKYHLTQKRAAYVLDRIKRAFST